MKKGLFRQYFTVFMVTLLSCTIILGVVLLTFSGISHVAQRRRTLESTAQRVLTPFPQYYQSGRPLTGEAVKQALVYASEVSGAKICVTDTRGVVLASSEDECTLTYLITPQKLEIIDEKGSYFGANYLSGVFKHKGEFLYGAPIVINEEKFGYVFTAMPVGLLYSYLGDTLFTYLFAAGVTMLVAFVVIYTATLSLTAPLQQMTKAAESFGKGDFSARIVVQGEDEIASLASSFNSMADSLAELEASRSSFVASVSHDLRTPMTTIGGYIDGILDGTIPPEMHTHYLSIVSQEVKRLARLTSSLLTITRLEARSQEEVELVPVNAGELIINILINLEQRIDEKRLVVDAEQVLDRYVMADKDMLHQIAYNLIDNAVKYTPEQGEISIKVLPYGERTNIVVKNSGSGISPDEASHIFERFYKVDKSRSVDKGSGLGLYIVKMLTSVMNGFVSVDSDGESYTEFSVNLQSAPTPRDLITVQKPSDKQSGESGAKHLISRLFGGKKKNRKTND